MRVLREGIVFGESTRWHDGRVWFSDWGAHQVVAVAPDGAHEVVVGVPSFPMCIDFLPDGRLLVVDSAHQRLLRREEDGSMVTHADLASVATTPWNEIVVDAGGAAYLNNIGFDFPAGQPKPGLVARVTPDGDVRAVADDLAFPNGMAITADGGTLVVAESHANRLTAFAIGPDGGLTDRRVWADAGGDHPDGICLDAEGAVWYADVANRHCVRIREGGEVLGTVELDRGAFSCTLSRGPEPELFIVGQRYGGPAGPPSGRLVAVPAPAGGAGRP
ncbi:SMP-30/gluconolactonase/LRE family protein [Frankia sp. AgB1.9]|uniref:SMP-30/gluconolactonase/LRE family protein n=1 Tax=unclassified Frankia TaxID=2632575 RepID=UPI0019349B83|nr:MULTISPECIES: SMP-30/gluconolactonase/LRE family protein [unclassified Frankia]MBL7488126.1 SMP-30/gluconolactonase/LRE family protein [Frankia sp. AgW1.1]MBL7552708.1 SMP-30/gluconolactonase/LRE family protein [Frankia sp. AgB1.9]MBL7624262.1 SMP-30/gluconolactonase/LRE family protein [Frankia sp. AgB1.8]